MKNKLLYRSILAAPLLLSGCTTVKGFFRGSLYGNIISIGIVMILIIWIVIRLRGRE